jgi:hypothetical protein
MAAAGIMTVSEGLTKDGHNDRRGLAEAYYTNLDCIYECEELATFERARPARPAWSKNGP